MKNRHLSIFAAFALLAGSAIVSGCTSETDNNFVVTIAPYNNTSKVYIDDQGYSCWDNNDQVYINSSAYTLEIDNHTCRINGVTPNTDGSYTAVYPASIVPEGTTLSGTSITGLTLPATQSYQLDGFNNQIANSYMAAHLGAYCGTMEFTHAGIALNINITNNFSRAILLSQVIVSDNLAPLSGQFNITGLATGEPCLVAANSTSTDTTVTLNIADGIELAAGASTSVTITLPPTDSYTGNKFTIRVCGYDQEHLNSGVSTLYEFTQRQNENATGCIPRNILAQVPVTLDNPHTMVLKGQGTDANPYKITTASDLRAMQHLVNGGYQTIGNCASYVSANYQLMDDIDMQGITLAPIGTNVNCFTGTFCGRGHTISNLTVSGNHCAGLFGYLTGSTAKVNYLTINNASITTTATENSYCGVICGRVSQLATIDHCQILGTCVMNTGNGSAYIGGIAGENNASTIVNAKCGAQILHTSGTANHFVGGIVGNMNANSETWNIYTVSSTATQIISAGLSTVGGIAGRCESTGYIRNGYFGAYNTIAGGANRTADICGYAKGGYFAFLYYPNSFIATEESTNTYYTETLTPSDGYVYQYQDGYDVLNALNYVAALDSDGQMDQWTAASTGSSPELDFSYSE